MASESSTQPPPTGNLAPPTGILASPTGILAPPGKKNTGGSKGKRRAYAAGQVREMQILQQLEGSPSLSTPWWLDDT